MFTYIMLCLPLVSTLFFSFYVLNGVKFASRKENRSTKSFTIYMCFVKSKLKPNEFKADILLTRLTENECSVSQIPYQVLAMVLDALQ